MRHKKRYTGAGDILLWILLGYLMLSTTVFAFRHPWMTKTEQFLHVGDALTWQTVPYSEREKWYK